MEAVLSFIFYVRTIHKYTSTYKHNRPDTRYRNMSLDFLNQMLGAQRSIARAQLGVSKICLEQQLYRNLMCNMCGMNGGSCYCGPYGGVGSNYCGPYGGFGSNCCVDSCNVTHKTIQELQAKNTIILYLGENGIDEKGLRDLFAEAVKLSAAKNNANEWAIQGGGRGGATKPADLYALITQGAKRFAVYLIQYKNAKFIQQQ